MKLKRAIFPVSILSTVTLMGCNLDTNDSYSQTEITAMSGYLGSALICSAEKTESCNEDRSNVLGTTNSNGKLNTNETSLQSPLIARIDEGISFDSDKIGVARKSYTLFAPAGSTIITPFTTIMYTNSIRVQMLADWLRIEEKFISGDYIALKSNEEDNYKAQQAHLLARTITDLALIDETDFNKLKDDLQALGYFVDELVNDGDKLDEVKITRDIENNFIKEKANHNSLAAYVDGNKFINRSLNESHPTDEGDYKNGELTIEYIDNELNVNGSRDLYSYTASGSVIKAPGVAYIDTYYYASDNVALVSTSRMGLDLVTQESLSSAGSVDNLDSKLQDNSWYYLSPTESLALADITKFSFKNNKTLTIKINDDSEFEGLWEAKGNQLEITSNSSAVNYKLELEFKIDDDNVLPVINTVDGENQYGLFIGTLEFAEQIKKLWNKGKH